MNKRYMDFVPTKPAKTPVKKAVARKSVTNGGVASKQLVRAKASRKDDVLKADADTFSLKREPEYGVIEDFRPKFVKTEVEKRPLSRGHFAQKKSDLAEAKSVKVAAKKLEKPAKVVEKPVEKSEKPDKTKMKIPKSPFINQGKLEKRPLSKNVYEKAIKPTEEKDTGPITIISKPEKDTKVSLIVTIILTIILGAAAGTIAFLLLPK